MRSRLAFWQIILILFCFCIFASDLQILAKDRNVAKKTEETVGQNPEAVHAQPWAFGATKTRNAPIWQKGVTSGDIKKNSIKGTTQQQSETSRVIDHALQEAKRKTEKQSYGLSMQRDASTWKVSPDQKSMRSDEERVRDKRHVLRAWAGVNATDDLNISVGPELILKDEANAERAARSSEPDSSLGMGMKFKFDF